MSARPGDDAEDSTTVGVNAVDVQRYAEITLENGAVLIYDQENEDAWLQSESANELEMMA